MGFGGFSWKRAVGLSAAKARLSRRIGIPLTRGGRQRKLGRMISGGGMPLRAGRRGRYSRRPGRVAVQTALTWPGNVRLLEPVILNVDFPLDLLHAIDREAQRIGVNRQAFIKLRLADAVTTRASR